MNLKPYSKVNHSRFFLCVLFFSFIYIFMSKIFFVHTLLSSQNTNKPLLENRLKDFPLDKMCFPDFLHLNFLSSVVLGKGRTECSYFGTFSWKYPTNEGSRDPIEQYKKCRLSSSLKIPKLGPGSCYLAICLEYFRE